MTPVILKKRSAFLPLGMSLAALVLVVAHFAVFGITHDPDEGAAAHVFQLLMVAQMPIVAFFVVEWLPQAPKEGLVVLALLAVLWLAAFAGVFFLT